MVIILRIFKSKIKIYTNDFFNLIAPVSSLTSLTAPEKISYNSYFH